MRLGYEVFHSDVGELVTFYVTVLGFEALPSDEQDIFVVVQRDAVRVACALHTDAIAGPTDRRPPHGSEIILRVDDIDAEYKRVRAANWPVADSLKEQTWGLRDFRIFDPTGQYLRITEDVRRNTDAHEAKDSA